MVTEALAMIGRDHNRRIVVPPAPFERVEQPADDLVGEGDFAVVRIGKSAMRRGRCVGFVWLVDVEEAKRARSVEAVEPSLGRIERLGPGALHLAG